MTWALVGPRSRSRTTTGARRTPTAPSSELRTSGRRVMPDSSAPRSSTRTRLLAVLVGGAGGVPHLDDLVVAHQLAGPLDQPDADEQQREAQRRAQGDVGGAQPEDRLHVCAVAAAVDVEGEVGDDEQHRADRRQAEQRRDLPLGALLGLRVDVGRPPHVLGQARVGDRLVADELAAVPVVGVAVTGQLGRWVWSSVMPRPPPSSSRSERCGRRSRSRSRPARRCPRSRRTGPRSPGPMPPRSKPPYSGCSRSE